jgi:hypothetical protein
LDPIAEIDGLPAPDALDARGRRLFEYWAEKRGSRKMPARADIEPTDIPTHLPDIGLVDVLPEGPHFRYRLLGTRQVAARGCDPTGRPVVDGFLGRDISGMREQVLSNYRRVCAHGRPLFRDTSIAGQDNRGDMLWGGRFVARYTLFLPLGADGTTPDIILFFTDFRPC